MKKFLSTLAVLCLLSGMAVQAQSDAKAIHALDKKTDLLLDSAAKHMIHFILTKDEAEYTKSINIAKEAQANNITLDSMAKTSHVAFAKEVNQYVASNIEELAAYNDPKLKQTVLLDTDKSEKVLHKGKKYMVGKPSKDLYYKFIEFLPAN